MTTLYLVSCVSRKRSVPCEARDLYISDWFSYARRYVEKQKQPWFILSTIHGLVHPTQRLEPYDMEGRGMRRVPYLHRIAWAQQVFVQLEPHLPVDRIVFYAGFYYREFLAPMLLRNAGQVEVPLADMGIGEQKHWFAQSLLESLFTRRSV